MRSVRTHILVLLLIAFVAVVLTYPAALETVRGSALPGLKDFDEFEYTWLLWWYKTSLVDLQHDPANLPFYYPMETNLPLVTVTPLGWLLAIPLVLVLGPIGAYSAYWLLNFVLCGYTAYLLALWLTKSRHAAVVAGLLFAFYPGKMLHGLGHFGDMMIYMFPLYALFLSRFVQRPESRRVWPLAAVTAMGLLIDFRHIGLFYLPFTAIYLVFELIRGPRRLLTGHFLRLSALAVGAVAVLTLPFFGPFILSSLGGGLAHFKEGGLEASSADVLSLVLPPMTHPVLGQIPLLKQWMEKVWTESLYIETCLYFGVVAVVLAILALLKRRREVWLWLIVVLVGVVLALGPVLKVGGQRLSGVPLPYALVNRLPFYEWVRIPARMDMMIKLALAMLAALGAGVLVRRVSPRGKVIVSGALCGLMLFEYLTFAPYPMAKVYPSDFLSGLAGDGQDYGILHIASHEYSMYLQTLHRHRMVEGHIHRWPPGGSEWALQLHGLALFPPEAEQPYYDILDKKLPYGRDGGDIFAGTLDLSPANILARLGIRYVVFERKSPWTKHDGDVYLVQLGGYFGKPIHEDKRLNIYEVRRRPAGGPELTPGEGWYRLEGAEHETWRWMKERAAVDISGLSGSQAYRLKLTVRPRQAPQNLTVAVDQNVIGEYRLTSQREIMTPPFMPGNTSAALHLSTPEGCARPLNVLRGNLDSRCLGLAFDEVRLFPALRELRRFGEQLDLVGYELTRGSGLDRSLYLGLYWQAVGHTARDYTVFVHAVDERGQTVVQDDQQLRTRRGSPTSAWAEGEGVRSLHQLDLPAETETGTLRLKVGLYDVESMERLPLAGDQSGENAVTITESGEAQ